MSNNLSESQREILGILDSKLVYDPKARRSRRVYLSNVNTRRRKYVIGPKHGIGAKISTDETVYIDMDVAYMKFKQYSFDDRLNDIEGFEPLSDDRIFLHCLAGEKESEIARKFGVTRQAIYARIRKRKQKKSPRAVNKKTEV